MSRDEAYDARILLLANEYSERALAILTNIGQICEDAGMKVDGEAHERFDDDFAWSMVLFRTPDGPHEDTDIIDVTLELNEAREYGDGDGIAWGIMIVEYGGRILGQLQPFNYTEQCWVPLDSAEAIEERFKLLEDAEYATIPDLCKKVH